MRVAAETFSITPKIGSKGDPLTRAKVSKVYSPLKTTITLIEDEQTRVCVITSHFKIETYRYSNLMRKRVAEALGISKNQVFSFGSHNHCCVEIFPKVSPSATYEYDVLYSEDQLTWEGKEILKGLMQAAKCLPKKFVPVQVWWGVGHERRITHNRKGRRADGSTYLMREEDRLLLGRDFNGDIDDEAPIVAFMGMDGKPVAFLVQFTGHPLTAYNPGSSVVFGEYPQVACDDLSEAFGGAPVGFLQGCAGDHNSKGLLSGKSVEESIGDATRYGHYLGKTYIKTARKLQRSSREDLAFTWEWVRLPFKKVPSARVLKKQLVEMGSFLKRCEQGDENTRTCVGLNFPSTMSPRIRAILVQPLKRWAKWALSFHTEGRLDKAPTHLDLEMGVLCIGDVGIIGMPCEPFSGIGRQIKQDASLPLVVPCAYMNDASIAYVPDGPNNGDTEYMSASYRYTTSLLPYKNPAGDLLARAGARMLRDCIRHLRT